MATIVNQHSVNFLRFGALGLGVWWGVTRHYSLTGFVKDRAAQQDKARYLELVEEGKIAFEAQYNKEQAVLAAKAGIPAIDSDSLYFDAETWANWAVAEYDKANAPAPKK
ncbi:hypothetical protein BC831DRAFT_496207 [Entophlyctis helioformis]|nr:hypothetical protein BC831DRAFT_496207 [Entophlyctis helioformis]